MGDRELSRGAQENLSHQILESLGQENLTKQPRVKRGSASVLDGAVIEEKANLEAQGIDFKSIVDGPLDCCAPLIDRLNAQDALNKLVNDPSLPPEQRESLRNVLSDPKALEIYLKSETQESLRNIANGNIPENFSEKIKSVFEQGEKLLGTRPEQILNNSSTGSNSSPQANGNPPTQFTQIQSQVENHAANSTPHNVSHEGIKVTGISELNRQIPNQQNISQQPSVSPTNIPYVVVNTPTSPPTTFQPEPNRNVGKQEQPQTSFTQLDVSKPSVPPIVQPIQDPLKVNQYVPGSIPQQPYIDPNLQRIQAEKEKPSTVVERLAAQVEKERVVRHQTLQTEQTHSAFQPRTQTSGVFARSHAEVRITQEIHHKGKESERIATEIDRAKNVLAYKRESEVKSPRDRTSVRASVYSGSKVRTAPSSRAARGGKVSTKTLQRTNNPKIIRDTMFRERRRALDVNRLISRINSDRMLAQLLSRQNQQQLINRIRVITRVEPSAKDAASLLDKSRRTALSRELLKTLGKENSIRILRDVRISQERLRTKQSETKIVNQKQSITLNEKNIARIAQLLSPRALLRFVDIVKNDKQLLQKYGAEKVLQATKQLEQLAKLLAQLKDPSQSKMAKKLLAKTLQDFKEKFGKDGERLLKKLLKELRLDQKLLNRKEEQRGERLMQERVLRTLLQRIPQLQMLSAQLQRLIVMFLIQQRAKALSVQDLLDLIKEQNAEWAEQLKEIDLEILLQAGVEIADQNRAVITKRRAVSRERTRRFEHKKRIARFKSKGASLAMASSGTKLAGQSQMASQSVKADTNGPTAELVVTRVKADDKKTNPEEEDVE